jgi:hypothetical protein
VRLRTKRNNLLGAAAVALALIAPAAAEAHCDSLDGPVITEARAALEVGDVTPVLKWVSQDYEAEIRAAFDHVAEVRKLGGQARSLADRFFFETLVRIHRAVEGAPYTGLKPEGSGLYVVEAAADEALAAGSVDQLATKIGERAAAGVRERFTLATTAKQHADENVKAGREYVEAYVDYVHYVLGVHNAIAGPRVHHHGASEPQAAADAGHGH